MVKVIFVCLLLCGCASTPPHDVAFCKAARPIIASKLDVLTPDTVKQILAHDKAGEALCGWKP